MISKRILKFDIMIYGDHCANDLQMGEFLSRRGLRVCIARKKRAQDSQGIDLTKDFFTAPNPPQIIVVGSPWQLIQLSRQARMVLTFTGAFGFALNWRWLLRRTLRLPPVMNYPTGSDFSELLSQSSILSRFYRYFVRTCAINVGFTYPHILKNILKFKVTNIAFFRHPYLLPGYRPMATNRKTVRYFHPSNLDIGLTDSTPGRNSTKGNDRFIRALLRAMDEGVDAECVILDRGPDRKIIRKMIESSKHGEKFFWRPHLNRDELFEEMANSDIVVDQFDVGGLGGLAIEAMAIGRAVLLHLETKGMPIVYPQLPPVLNAKSEEEIYQSIKANQDRGKPLEIGLRAHDWVNAYHSWKTCLDTLLFYYSLLTAHEVVDYGYK